MRLDDVSVSGFAPRLLQVRGPCSDQGPARARPRLLGVGDRTSAIIDAGHSARAALVNVIRAASAGLPARCLHTADILLTRSRKPLHRRV